MEFLTLQTVKKHLNIDEYFTDDDALIEVYIDAAERAIINVLDCDIDEIIEDGELPKPIYVGMMMLVANLYAHRETITPTSFIKVPDTIDLLLDPYKCYHRNLCSCRE